MSILRDNALRHIQAMPDVEIYQQARKREAEKVIVPFYDRGHPERVWPVDQHDEDLSGDLHLTILKTAWSVEVLQDAMAATGLDMTEEICSVIYEEVVAELISIRDGLEDEGKKMIPYIPLYFYDVVMDVTTFEPQFRFATQYIVR